VAATPEHDPAPPPPPAAEAEHEEEPDADAWVPSPGHEAPAPEGSDQDRPTGPAYTLARVIPAGPIRKFLSTHEVHILPNTVAHARRARRIGAAIFVAFLIFAAWYWVIPRVDVRVQAQYHEGLFNAIAVDVRVINDGSVALAPLHIELVVTDSGTGAAMGFFNVTASLAPHRTYNSESLQFKGDEIATNYTLSILVRFTAGTTQVTRSLDFRTEEPYMNLYFEGRVA
jgi:hypothetical protein